MELVAIFWYECFCLFVEAVVCCVLYRWAKGVCRDRKKERE